MAGEDANDVGEMHRREIRLEDGRYMIFYTFGDEAAGSETLPADTTAKSTETDTTDV